MKYLYIFEDNKVQQNDNEPTIDDIKSIEAGILMILRFNPDTQSYEDLRDDGKWIAIDKV